jgi:gamma-glutamyltranspeptidase/glutathione hydrolase
MRRQVGRRQVEGIVVNSGRSGFQRGLLALLLLWLVPGLAVAEEVGTVPAGVGADMQAPESTIGWTTHGGGRADHYMVAAANPLAASAGLEMLRAGGTAADAAVAVQLVLGLVEPQSSGLGGGGLALHWDAAARALTTLDGRETAPAAARPDRFLGPDGKPRAFLAAVVGGRSVGVPGTVRLMAALHARHGKLPWASLFAPAIRLAEDGFAISPRLNGLLALETALKGDAVARGYFYQDDGTAKPAGTVLRNPAYADTLRRIADGGPDAFYSGEIAADMVAAVRNHPTNPGDLAETDLAAYTVKERPAVCGPYRAFRVCSMGPPSSGGVAVLQILSVLETRDMAGLALEPVQAVHWIAEAERLAFADRALYMADPDFVKVPVKGLLDPGYLAGRARLVDPARSMGKAPAGQPPFQDSWLWERDESAVLTGTSHIAIIDGAGNALSLTTTIEDGFGARMMVRGFLLNNELTDFSFLPELDGRPVANRVEPGKRPRSSMSPTLVFDPAGEVRAVVGSPGGSAIINYVVKVLVALLDWGLDPQKAVDLANFGSRNGPTELEAHTEAVEWRAALEAMGHTVTVMDFNSGAQAVVRRPEGLVGGADFRREGVAIGD